MKKEWFEPGPDGASPFGNMFRKYFYEGMRLSESLSAAFLTLLAEDEHANIRDAELFEQQVLNDEPPALQVGDVVRLEAFSKEDVGYLPPDVAIGHVGEIYRIDPRKGSDARIAVEPDWYWPASACTLIRRAGEAQSVDTQRSIAAALANCQLSLQDEIVGLRDEVERLTARIAKMDPHGDRLVLLGEWNKAAAERDAARAEVERLTAQLLQVESFVRENNAPPARISKLINQRNELAALNKAYGQLRLECDDTRYTAQMIKDDHDALQAQLLDEQAKRASIEAELATCRESRDALQARIDAGVRVWGSGSVFGGESSRDYSDTHTALLIDIQPIATEMADERKTPGTRADRRQA